MAGAAPASLRDGLQHLQAMPERDTQVLEMLVGQVGENGDVNVVLGKALGVLGHAECFEPVRNLLHRGPVRLRFWIASRYSLSQPPRV